MTYNNAVKHINAMPEKHSVGLERMKTLCAALGSPQKQIRCVHICGDLGKSSCSSMLTSIIAQSGYTVGLYSISYAGELRERIRIGNKPIPHAEFADTVKSILAASDEHPSSEALSRDEMLFMVALLYFAKNNCCTMICERSFGKSEPAAIESPMLTVITTVNGGDSRPDFVGVIPRGTHEAVTSIQHKDVYSEISAACAEAGSRLTLPIYADLEVLKISLFKTVFTYRGIEYSIPGFSPCQLLNAITVLEAVQSLRRLGAAIPDEAVVKGLAGVDLSLKCHAIAIDPTVIIATVSTEGELEALVASLAQVSSLLNGSIKTFVSPSCERLCAALPSRLASCSLECDGPHLLPDANSAELSGAIKEIISPIADGKDPHSTTLFIGDESFTPEMFHMIQKNLGHL